MRIGDCGFRNVRFSHPADFGGWIVCYVVCRATKEAKGGNTPRNHCSLFKVLC